MEKKKEILNENNMIKFYLKDWFGVKEADPMPKVEEVMNQIGIDFKNAELQGLYFQNQELTLFLDTDSNRIKVSLLKESPESPKTIKVEWENEMKKYSYCKGFNVSNREGEITKRHKDSLRLYEYERVGIHNANHIHHRFDAFNFKTSLKAKEYELELDMKYPNYLTSEEETEYLFPDTINTILLNLKFPVAIERLYRDIIVYGTKRCIIFPSIIITIKRQGKIVDQIITENGTWKSIVKTYNDNTATLNCDGFWTLETPSISVQSKTNDEESFPKEVYQTRMLTRRLFEEE